MSKRIILVIAIALLMAGTTWASDIVLSPNLNNPGDSVNLAFNATGTLGITTQGFTSATPPGSGVTPGALGEINTLYAGGTFQGTYLTSVSNYGILGTYVNANANGGGGAAFVMTDHQIFDAMSGNHHNGITGDFFASASGGMSGVDYLASPDAAINMKSIGSMYVWSEATNGASSPLQGQMIEKGVSTTQNGNPLSNLYLGVQTTGIATMSNSAAWGWATRESGATTHYDSGTRSVSATGTGTLVQTVWGANGWTYTASYTSGGGGSGGGGVWNFTGGITGTYSMSAN